jgi:hypothetical protein
MHAIMLTTPLSLRRLVRRLVLVLHHLVASRLLILHLVASLLRILHCLVACLLWILLRLLHLPPAFAWYGQSCHSWWVSCRAEFASWLQVGCKLVASWLQVGCKLFASGLQACWVCKVSRQNNNVAQLNIYCCHVPIWETVLVYKKALNFWEIFFFC